MTDANDDRVARGLEAIDSRFVETNSNLVDLVRSVKEESHQRERKVEAISKLTKAVIGLLIIVLLTLAWQVNTTINSRQERRAQFSESTTRQEQLLKGFADQQSALAAAQKRQDSQAAATAWCTKQSTTITEYKSCLGQFGVTLPTAVK